MSTVQVDAINESTTNAGVTVDGVVIKDGLVDGKDVSTLGTSSVDGGLVKLADTDFTGESAVAFDSVFSSTYRNYKTLISIKPVDNNVHLYYRFRDGSGDISSSNYAYKALYALNSNTNNNNNGANNSGTTAGILIAGCAQNVAYHGYMEILEPNIADRTGVVGMQTGTGHLLSNSGSFNLTTQLTGIKFYAASGNISGSIQIYGYAT